MQEIKITPKHSINPFHRKESKFDSSYIVLSLDDKAPKEIIDLRFYFSGTTYYACFWLFDDINHANGSGSAGGYGYCKKSTAADTAIRKAGIEFKSIAGVGEGAIKPTLEDIAFYLGYKNIYIINAHG